MPARMARDEDDQLRPVQRAEGGMLRRKRVQLFAIPACELNRTRAGRLEVGQSIGDRRKTARGFRAVGSLRLLGP